MDQPESVIKALEVSLDTIPGKPPGIEEVKQCVFILWALECPVKHGEENAQERDLDERRGVFKALVLVGMNECLAEAYFLYDAPFADGDPGFFDEVEPWHPDCTLPFFCDT